MASKTEVKAELTLDDLASATLAKIQAGFGKVDQGVTSAQNRLLDFAKQTAAVAVGVNIGQVFTSAKDALMGSFHAAKEHDEQMRELSKTVAGMSTVSGKVEDLAKATNMTVKETWELKRAAKGATTDFATGARTVYDRLSDIAREAGVARSSLVEAFAETGKNTTRTNDQLVNLISQVASASKALSSPVKDIVAGFVEVEKNMISAGNPLIEMVKQANLFRGHNEQIALKLQSMGRQGMLNIMNKALKEMQERAKKMPMTLKEMGEQLGDMKTDVMKLVGGPMVGALTPAFRGLQRYLAENRGQIEQYAKMVGTKAGVWITEAGKLFVEGFQYLQAHADEIRVAIKEGFDYAKGIFKWMLEHKGALAAGFMASKVVGSGAVGGAVEGVKGVMEFSKALAAANAAGIGPLAAGSASAAASLGALSLAVGAVGLAVYQFGKYLDETGGYLDPSKGEAKKNLDAQMEAFQRAGGDFNTWGQDQIKAFDAMKAKALENALAIGANTQQLGLQIDAEYKRHRAIADAAKGMTEARDAVKGFEGADLSKLTEQQADQFSEAQIAAGKAFTESFNMAVKQNNVAALNAAVQIVAGSKVLQSSLLNTGESVGLSLEKLAEVIGDKAGDFGEKLKERAAADGKASAAKPPPTVMQFNGGQTFQIKQDFRDQDPDRVALTLFRDIRQAAENRLQAKTALPFGGLWVAVRWGCLACASASGVASALETPHEDRRHRAARNAAPRAGREPGRRGPRPGGGPGGAADGPGCRQRRDAGGGQPRRGRRGPPHRVGERGGARARRGGLRGRRQGGARGWRRRRRRRDGPHRRRGGRGRGAPAREETGRWHSGARRARRARRGPLRRHHQRPRGGHPGALPVGCWPRGAAPVAGLQQTKMPRAGG